MNTFIVRLYRSEDGSPDCVAGTVEDASGQGERRIFHSVQELCEFMNSVLRTGTRVHKKPGKTVK